MHGESDVNSSTWERNPDFDTFTPSLRYLGYNSLSGSIPNLTGLTNLQVLRVHRESDVNSTRSVPISHHDAFPQALRHLGYNSPSGSIPNLTGLTNVQVL